MTIAATWATALLACPHTGASLIERDGRLVTPAGVQAATVVNGIVRVPLPEDDSGITFYRAVGGAHFHERASEPYAMSALDTPVYHAHLAAIRPADPAALVIDVGGGDGRNALPWLAWGYRVVVVDAVSAALERLQGRIASEHPAWLDRLLLIEADVRHVPLVDACASRVQAIESLYYLNEDYEVGLRECVRLMAADAQLLVAERDYEGGLLTRLLYGGLRGLLEQADTRDVWDGKAESRVRSRCFTAAELAALLTRHGLRIVSDRGVPVLALVVGYLRARGALEADDVGRLPSVHDLLRRLGEVGTMRRCHVLVAERLP